MVKVIMNGNTAYTAENLVSININFTHNNYIVTSLYIKEIGWVSAESFEFTDTLKDLSLITKDMYEGYKSYSDFDDDERKLLTECILSKLIGYIYEYSDIRLHLNEKVKFAILCGYKRFMDELKQRGN